jgi:hypothetical protein
MNEKIEQVRILIVGYWLSNDSAATVPPNESCLTSANENREYVGPILCAHMRGGIGCNLAMSKDSFIRCFHEWIWGWAR